MKRVDPYDYDGYETLRASILALFPQVDPLSPEEAQRELDYLKHLYEDYRDFYKWYKRQGTFFHGIIPNFVGIDKYFDDRADSLYPMLQDPYYNDLVLSEDEVVNGYHLYDSDPLPILDKETYVYLVDLWNGEDWTEQEFRETFERQACTDWNKMDANGESYVGHWLADEYANAWSLTRQDNINALCALPFPRRVMWETIVFGCKTRRESVRYTNFVCTWIKRKMY